MVTSMPSQLLRPGEAGTVPARVAPAAQAALRELFEAHHDYVRRLCARLGGPSVEADDLAQEVFLVALRRWEDFEGRSSPRTWLHAITLRVVAAGRRRARLRRFLGLEAVPEPSHGVTPAHLAEQHEAARIVYEILDRIAEKKRVVFILFELEGLSGEEIACAVGCPVKTVWTRLHHARREVSAALARREARR